MRLATHALVLTLAATALTACGWNPSSASGTKDGASDDGAPKLYLAVESLADDSVRLIGGNADVAVTSLSFCEGRRKDCEGDDATLIPGIRGRGSRGGVLYVSESRLRPRNGAYVSVRAETRADGVFWREFRLVKASGGATGGIEPSLGSGGKAGFQEFTFTASNGQQSRFKFDIPDDVGLDKPYGVLIYLHGDMGADYDWFYPKLKSVAQSLGLIPMAVRSPTSYTFSSGSGPTWWVDGDKNAVFLDELLKKQLLERYNIDKRRIYYTGASGGPTFLSGTWIKHYAHQYRGGAVLFCGGMTNTALPYRTSEGFEKDFRLSFYIGTSDFLLSGAQQAASFYKGKGFSVSMENPPGVGHCQFTDKMPNLLYKYVAGYMGKDQTPPKNFALTNYVSADAAREEVFPVVTLPPDSGIPNPY